MSKQTAVEWLVEQMIDKLGIRIENTTEGCELFEQAKAMERKQIIQSNRDGVDMVVDKKPFVTGEQYYTKTYGGDK